MNRNEYWKWIWDIWKYPLDATRRLVFADWLEEQGCLKAARKQRQYAAWVNAASAAIYKPESEQIWLFIENRKGTVILMRMKKDGNIHPMPKGAPPYIIGRGNQYLKRAK